MNLLLTERFHSNNRGVEGRWKVKVKGFVCCVGKIAIKQLFSIRMISNKTIKPS